MSAPFEMLKWSGSVSLFISIATSVGNPPFFQDFVFQGLDLVLELLCSESGIEIWNTEWNNVPTGLDCGFGIYLLDLVDCGIGIQS